MINNKKNVISLKVNFQLKNKNYNKDIFVIITDNMEQNLKKSDNIQYFMDVTYYATLPNRQK